MTVIFFGHRDAPEEIRSTLHTVLEQLIEKQEEILFLIGNRGRFDRMVLYEVKKMKKKFPWLEYRIVLANIPQNGEMPNEEIQYTIVADGCEECHPRYAIIRCNRWLVQKADLVITYVSREFGGAATFQREAKRKGKRIINLAEKRDI